MSDKTRIGWSDATLNVANGCRAVSPGCDACYARERTVPRFAAHPNPRVAAAYAGLVGADGAWTGRVNLRPDQLDYAYRWQRPRAIFVAAQGDLFYSGVPDTFIASVFAAAAHNPRHTFMILTKRPGRARSLLTRDRDPFQGMVRDAYATERTVRRLVGSPDPDALPWPLPNVWLGTSVEDQERAALRVPLLTATPAALRFLSCEPLLAPVDLAATGVNPFWCLGHGRPARECPNDKHLGRDGGIRWVIVGGESGPKARPMHPEWVRGIRDDCAAAGVPFFFKQWGAWAPLKQLPGTVTVAPSTGSTVVAGKTVFRVGAHRAGNILDGAVHEHAPPLSHEVTA